MKKFVGTIAALTGAALLILASATAASASPIGHDPGPETTPDRIIQVDHPAPSPAVEYVVSVVSPEGGGYEAFRALDSEFPLIPEPGETVRIVYTDAVTDVTTEESTSAEKSTAASAAASCTRSVTVNTPYEVSSRPRVSGSGMISSGCTSGSTFNLHLYDPWYERADGSVFVPNNGSSWGVNIIGNTCWGSSSTSYRALGQWGVLGGTYGPTATLTCSY